MNDILAGSDLVAAGVAIIAMLATLLQARKVYRLQRLQIRIQYRSNVRDWAREVVAVMSECVIVCELDPRKAIGFFSLRNRLRARLSELIDCGRWFYENTDQEDYGQWKEGAFRGLAPKAISEIKTVHKLIEKLNYRQVDANPCKRDLIVTAKRQFASEIQALLQPSSILDELKLLDKPR